jgi:hypothetical protein
VKKIINPVSKRSIIVRITVPLLFCSIWLPR